MQKPFTWRKWKIGLVISICASGVAAGAGGLAGMTGWKPFVAVFCSSVITHVGTFLKNHPVEDVEDAPASVKP